MTKTLTHADLRQFTGTEQWFRHPLNRQVLYTEGAQYLAEQAGAYWLLDEIALSQMHIAALRAEPFQVWKLTVKPDRSGRLVCEDGEGRRVFSKRVPFTDFPLDHITLYFTGGVILLPSEY